MCAGSHHRYHRKKAACLYTRSWTNINSRRHNIKKITLIGWFFVMAIDSAHWKDCLRNLCAKQQPKHQQKWALQMYYVRCMKNYIYTHRTQIKMHGKHPKYRNQICISWFREETAHRRPKGLAQQCPCMQHCCAVLMYRLVGQVRCCHGGHIPCATGNELHRHVLGLLIACAALVEPVSPVQTNTNALRGARMVLEEEKPASEACIFDKLCCGTGWQSKTKKARSMYV